MISFNRKIEKINIIYSDHTNFLAVLPETKGSLAILIITEDNVETKTPYLKKTVESNNFKNWNN